MQAHVHPMCASHMGLFISFMSTGFILEFDRFNTVNLLQNLIICGIWRQADGKAVGLTPHDVGRQCI